MVTAAFMDVFPRSMWNWMQFNMKANHVRLLLAYHADHDQSLSLFSHFLFFSEIGGNISLAVFTKCDYAASTLVPRKM